MNLQPGKSALHASCFLFFALPVFCLAQHTIVLGGTVRNEVGKPIANAHISARGARTGTSSEALTGADGSYSLSGLTAGAYSVTATASGFATTQTEVTLTGGGKPTLDLRLARAGEQQKLPNAPSASAPLPNAPSANAPPPQAPSLQSLGFSQQQTQANPALQVRLDKRTEMLKIHQRLGLITLAPMAADLVTGPMAKAKSKNGQLLREPTQANLDLHAALGSTAVALYASTAYFAMFAPKIPGVHKRGAIRVHEWLAFVHGPGMILTPILGSMAFSQEQNGEKVHGIASAHGAVATATVIAYGASIIAVAWPIHLKFWEK